MGIHVTAAKQAKYFGMKLALTKSVDCELASFISAEFWDLIKSKKYIRLDNIGLAAELLKFLKNCGLEANNFLVRFQPTKIAPGTLDELKSDVQRCFSSTWNALPVPEVDDIDHDSRPRAYLLLPARPNDHSSRSVGVKGLIALMYCTRILVSLTKENNNAVA